MAVYDPDIIRDFVARFGSIKQAEEEAGTVPGFGEEIERVQNRIGWLVGVFPQPPPDELEKLEAERRRLVVEALKEDADVEGGALLPRGLVERAVRSHVELGLGKRRVAQMEPGLTDWYAGQILRWYSRGEPEGLWLDHDGRLCWGTSITPVWREREEPGAAPAPACSHLRLPRI